MKTESALSVVRLIRATRYAAEGLVAAWRGEAAFRLEVIVAGILAPIGWVTGGTGVERALLLGSLVVVLLTELLNSAIEATVDRIGPERHPLSKRAKDLGAAAVMVALINAGVIWLAVWLG
ncbi:MAG: diacylglycerol kinase [Nitrospiria bacterium]